MSCNCIPGSPVENSVYRLIPGPTGPMGPVGVRGRVGETGATGPALFKQFQTARDIRTIPPGGTVVDLIGFVLQ